MDLIMQDLIPLPVSDNHRRQMEYVSGSNLLWDQEQALLPLQAASRIIQKYVRFWFSEIGKLICESRMLANIM